MDAPQLGESSPEELQRRFVLHPETPIIHHSWAPKMPKDTDQTYAFQWDGQSMGEVNVRVIPDDLLIIVCRFFPFMQHATYEDLIRMYGDKGYVDKQRLWLACNSGHNVVPDHLHRKGLGTLAHILVIRSLCEQLMQNKSQFKIRYYSAGSIKPRLIKLLDRLGVGEMAKMSLPLDGVQREMENKAREIFGFTFEELPSSFTPTQS